MSAAHRLLAPEERARLAAFRREVEKALPGKVVDMRLFGSRARGDFHEDSDYDIAVFVGDLVDGPSLRETLSDLAYPFVLDGYFIRAIGLPADYLRHVGTYRPELADEIARDGIPIP